MPYADPNSTHNPTTGVTIPASWGDIVRDQVVWLAGDAASGNPKPMCIIYGSSAANQSIPNASFTALNQFNTAQVDTASMWSFGTPSRITIPVTGVYTFGANATFAGNATGAREFRIGLNGRAGTPADVAVIGWSVVGSGDQRMNLSGMWKFTAGDYISAYVYQASGAALNVLYELGTSPVMWCRWVGVG